MKTFKIKEYNILKSLEKIYNVQNVRYNIMTSNFIYYQNDEKKHISLHSLVNYLKHEKDHDTELYTLLNSLYSSYFDNRIKKYFITFYEKHQIPVPRDIFITSGFIEFHTAEGYNFYLPYDDDFDKIFKEAEHFIK